MSHRENNTLNVRRVVSQIAQHLDLNSLHDLSATCRQFRAHLLEYRKQLMKHTLRCVNDQESMGLRLANRMMASHQAWRQTRGQAFEGNLTSGKVGLCARDMVGPCRNCGMVVCRVRITSS